MEARYRKQHELKDGFVAGLPLVIGYVPIGMAFGVLSKTMDVTFIDSILFSAIVFAGASQFMALNLLAMGAGAGEIILTTLLVNLRHILMSASLAARLKDDIKKWIPFIAFSVTDETFSVASFKEGELTKEFILSLQLISYLAWVGATGLGYIVGSILPEVMKDSMGVGLYAMFVAILIPEAKKSTMVVILACLSGILNTLLKYFLSLSQGWSIIISIVVVSYLGLYLFEAKGEETHE
ncbi:AzlC family ABC transporter permease [Wukongibacter baidiensis]|uniref:AzlC family ABC transporter permease n=1 Tax=Wukongibacter baidiensis TaxID=1723361 RepID=UPI003D7FF573